MKQLMILAALFLIFGYVQSNPIDRLKNDHVLMNIFKSKLTPAVTCEACELLLPVIRKAFQENQTEQISFIAENVCILFKIENSIVCHQVLDEYLFSVQNVVLTTLIPDKQLCAAALNCGAVDSPLLNWNITLPSNPKPPVVPPTPPKQGAPTLRILHLSDIHIDFEYQPGSLAVCSEPICCRNLSTPKQHQNVTPDQMAGYWGDTRHCDIPLYTVEHLFDHISKNEQFDFIYWTGDLPPHNVWHQTRDEAVSALRVLTDLFLKYFPGKVVYPSLGNHEAAPCNLYPTPATPADNNQWLYDEIAKDWIQTGLPSSLVESIKYGAFYFIDIQPGLRLISMNMNYCPTLNFWLFINTTDPLDQLKWLANTLQDCEDNGIKAHIIGHINPAGCMSSWSFNYYRIVNRYESTIVGQFFGHTHNDEFEIFYDLDEPTRPTGIAWVTGSVTTEPQLFPGYRIYTVDGPYTGASYWVLDHENSIMNITDANLTNEPKWIKEYSAKATYGIDMYPADWNNLINRLLKDPSDPLADKLYTYYYKSLDSRPPCNDAICKREFLCHFKQARPSNIIDC